METIIELLLPHIEVKDIATFGNTNRYWNERIHGMLPLKYYLTVNYSDGILMSGTVYKLMIPLPSICSDQWKILFTLNNSQIPPFETLKFFVLSISPMEIIKNTTPLFHMYKHSGNIYWCTAKNCRYNFRPKDYTNLEKIEIEFRLNNLK